MWLNDPRGEGGNLIFQCWGRCENDHKTLGVTHRRHGLLVKGEGDVGTAVVLVTGARVAFAGRRGEVGAFARAQTRLHEAVALPDGDAGLA